uniref:cyclin-dependent protein kinase inhibitor SMR2-like n=1 Tax=Fragaria vesca subsp. vesca TaxID=101020 RepID=UPI0005C8C675|nr:PREDICTED: cyclin-dependent protein kinase inhibitor SMR2-like [Fragaria vesca subsp. vesca]
MATTGLDLCQDLPSLMRSLPSIKIQTPKPQQPQPQDSITTNDAVLEDECCRTPKSEASKIPAVVTCPPAPRKPRRAAGSCKRKLTELQFFEVVNRDEVEAFFGSTGLFNKRSCPCK